MRNQAERRRLVQKGMAPLLLALLPGRQHRPAPIVGSRTAPPSRLRNRQLRDLAAIEQRQRQPVRQHRPQFLHQIERQAWPARPVAMQEADGRIETDALGGAAAIVGQQRIEERKQRIDGIERRAAAAPANRISGSGERDQCIEDSEIILRRLALGAAQRFDPFVHKATRRRIRASRSIVPQSLRRRCPRHPRAVVAQSPLQHGALVGDLGRDDAAHDLVRLFGGTILRTPQQHIAADRPFDRAPGTGLTIEQHEGDAGAGQRADQRRRNEDRAENTTEPSMCKGTRARSAPSTSATKFSPSLRSHAPSVVT